MEHGYKEEYAAALQGVEQACRNPGMLNYKIPARFNFFSYNFDRVIKLSANMHDLSGL